MTSSSRCARRAVGTMTSFTRRCSSTTVLRPDVETARARQAFTSPVSRCRYAMRCRAATMWSRRSRGNDNVDDARLSCRAASSIARALGARRLNGSFRPSRRRSRHHHRHRRRRPSCLQQSGDGHRRRGRAAASCQQRHTMSGRARRRSTTI